MRPAGAALLSALEDPDPSVADVAVQALRKIASEGHPALGDLLALARTDGPARRRAVILLGYRGDLTEEAERVLLSALGAARGMRGCVATGGTCGARRALEGARGRPRPGLAVRNGFAFRSRSPARQEPPGRTSSGLVRLLGLEVAWGRPHAARDSRRPGARGVAHVSGDYPLKVCSSGAGSRSHPNYR